MFISAGLQQLESRNGSQVLALFNAMPCSLVDMSALDKFSSNLEATPKFWQIAG
jgi:hypothetical protein